MDWFAINPRFMRNLTKVAAWPGAEQASYLTEASLILRPVQADDVAFILEMHQRLSAKSIYHRYHSPRIPTKQEITQICQLAAENGRAVVAAVGGKKPAIVGLAYYIVAGLETAEVGLLVEDRFQGQGIGKRLLYQLATLAVTQGICFFDAYVLPSNKPMIHLLHNIGLVVHNRLDYHAREMRIRLTAVGAFDPAHEPAEVEAVRKMAA